MLEILLGLHIRSNIRFHSFVYSIALLIFYLWRHCTLKSIWAYVEMTKDKIIKDGGDMFWWKEDIVRSYFAQFGCVQMTKDKIIKNLLQERCSNNNNLFNLMACSTYKQIVHERISTKNKANKKSHIRFSSAFSSCLHLQRLALIYFTA